jgi:hypothetical protein
MYSPFHLRYIDATGLFNRKEAFPLTGRYLPQEMIERGERKEAFRQLTDQFAAEQSTIDIARAINVQISLPVPRLEIVGCAGVVNALVLVAAHL